MNQDEQIQTLNKALSLLVLQIRSIMNISSKSLNLSPRSIFEVNKILEAKFDGQHTIESIQERCDDLWDVFEMKNFKKEDTEIDSVKKSYLLISKTVNKLYQLKKNKDNNLK